MKFSVAAVASCLAFASSALALPAPGAATDVEAATASVHGTLVAPKANAEYKVGDLFTFKFKRVNTTSVKTNSLNVTLVTQDGKVTRHDNVWQAASGLSSPYAQEYITAQFRIPKLISNECNYSGYPTHDWVATLMVDEVYAGQLILIELRQLMLKLILLRDSIMTPSKYPMPEGLYAIPEELLDLRTDDEVDDDVLHPKPVTSDKNVWFFWHSGYVNAYPYAKRVVRSWHRRFSRLGWSIRVLDNEPGSTLNISHWIDTSNPDTVPQAFRDGTLDGAQARQHISDLVRFPLLLKYGGIWADIGFIQIGDLDRLWNETIGNSESPIEIISYDSGDPAVLGLTNYFMAAKRDNPFFLRCHKLLLALWASDGGKTNTTGMHLHPLVKHVPLMQRKITFEENGRHYSAAEVDAMLSDYIIQGQAISMVMGLVDKDDDWDGPAYIKNHIYTIAFLEGAQLINELTTWNGPRQFELMSLRMPERDEAETLDQAQARDIVEQVLRRSFGFKLATGIILRILGPTLGSLWRDNGDSDVAEGTYAAWFRHATTYWTQKKLPARTTMVVDGPYKVGPLLAET
ncbi:hypothetical protein OIV83_001809 [Microbotryomycetes sp. JL201]|nr:hypothetical protein OIV83_001809 [Microbotryomycetes sp. JL201]